LAKKAESRYKITLQTGFVMTLLLLISIFYLFPRFPERVSHETVYQHQMEIISIPPTRQIKRRPPPPRPLIPTAEAEPEILKPVPLDSPAAAMAAGKDSSSEFLSGLPDGFRPKQILEVVPEKVSQIYRGVVVLALKIDRKGMVSEVRLLKNTTGTGECEQKAVKAARASIWEPAVVSGHPVTYWIEKTYRFNIE
jgi:TonB family protein